MYRKQLPLFALSCMIILVCSSSGCILDPFQENYLSISYWAEYDEKVDIKSVETIFTQNNITCKLNEYNDLSFSFSPKFRITKNLSRVNRLLFRVSYYCINLI